MEVFGDFRGSSFWDPFGGRSQTEMSRRMNCGSGDNSLEPFSLRREGRVRDGGRRKVGAERCVLSRKRLGHV